MRKLLFTLFTLMTFVFSGCTPKITGDERIAEDFVKSKGYTITARKGQIQKYILEKNKLYGKTETIPYQQSWGVQKVEPDKYFGKEIRVYHFRVKGHPLEETFKVKTTNVYIMICDSKVIGGYSFPVTKEAMAGGVYSLDGKTLEEMTGLGYSQWSENWKRKYGN